MVLLVCVAPSAISRAHTPNTQLPCGLAGHVVIARTSNPLQRRCAGLLQCSAQPVICRLSVRRHFWVQLWRRSPCRRFRQACAGSSQPPVAAKPALLVGQEAFSSPPPDSYVLAAPSAAVTIMALILLPRRSISACMYTPVYICRFSWQRRSRAPAHHAVSDQFVSSCRSAALHLCLCVVDIKQLLVPSTNQQCCPNLSKHDCS